METTTATVKPIIANSGRAFEYLVNLETCVVHTRKTCSGVGRGAAAQSMLVRDTNPGPNFVACGKCVPAKCLA